MIDLSCLGIDTVGLRVYRHLLAHPGGPGSDPGSGAGLDLPEEQFEAAVTVLAEHGLVRGSGTAWTAVDPAIAVERLIDRRFTELNEDLRRVTAARAAIPELSTSYHGGRTETPPLDIERLEDLADIHARLDDLAFFARQEVLSLRPGLSPEMIEACRPVDLRCLRRGIVLRTLVSRTAVENPITLAYLNEIAGLGAQIRVCDGPLEKLITYDGSLAVVPVDPQDNARGALVIRQASLVAGMVRLFEEIWSSAKDLAAPTGTLTLSPVELQVLRILCEVDKDEIGARRMGVSLRTFRRYVADLMQRLNASNRFHAALLAKEAGWI